MFWSLESVVAGDPEDLAVALNSVASPKLLHDSVFMRDLSERVENLDRCHVILDELLAAVEGDTGRFWLDFDAIDELVDGLDDANHETSEPVALLLALVNAPPRWIIEAPSDATLAAMSRPYSFASLWDRYVRFNTALYRRLVVRYTIDRKLRSLCALELFNEPDYNWLPQEVKIEYGAGGLINPLGKYVTELQLSQIPVADTAVQAFEPTAWGFQAQDAAWARAAQPAPGVLEFDWGRKFDWYVMCAAQLQTHMAWAIKDEAAQHGVQVITVSGSVTHNNIDFLLRMHRADPHTFDNIDKIGIHPYHWVNHDVADRQFVRADGIAGWSGVNPRRYAESYFKRFDFLTAWRQGSGDPKVDAEIKAVFGSRKLWITEFGLGTKVLGRFNAPIAEHTTFVRPRGLVGATAGYPDVIWEDLWEAFLDQVDDSWLREHDVECWLVYGLRELNGAGLDLDDDDRSNLALLHHDSTPRADPLVIEQIGRLMHRMTGRTADYPTSATKRIPSELYRRPWRSVALSKRATEVPTMLSTEERQLLYWVTASYRTGAGAIVDGGCFVGGSTVALAEGLRSSGTEGVVDVYDRFEVESYMNDFYLKGEALSAGESFRPIFDRNVDHVAELLRVHEGDLMAEGWSGDPIEVLFIDFAKNWSLNDFIVAEFFPSLIPNRSIVVQQDFVFAFCPWVALTMEYLSDYFEPVGFAEYCSVVYLCRCEVPADLPRVSEISHEQRLQLIDRAIARFRGYPQQVLDCAKATLLAEHGDLEQARAILDHVSEHSAHPSVQAAIDLVSSFAGLTRP